MKKIILFLFLFFVIIKANAQSYSYIKPSLIVWEVENSKISLKKGLNGITSPNELKLSLYFKSNDVKNYLTQGVVLQFRWYYYLSTRKKLVKVENIPFSKAHNNTDGSISISSTLRGVQPGWWEVQVLSTTDRKRISYAGIDRYQIFILPRSYTLR